MIDINSPLHEIESQVMSLADTEMALSEMLRLAKVMDFIVWRQLGHSEQVDAVRSKHGEFLAMLKKARRKVRCDAEDMDALRAAKTRQITQAEMEETFSES